VTNAIYTRPEAPEGGPYRIGEVARLLKVNSHSIRRAERENRLPKARREKSSNERYYTASDLAILRDYFQK
jgi:DNA-binding transcriptional MerR regulator